MRLLAFLTDSGSVTRILAHLDEPTKAPHISPAARGPPWEKDFEPRQGTDLSKLPPKFEFDQPAELVGAFPLVPARRRTSTRAGALASSHRTPPPKLASSPRQPRGRPD